jgi:F0F1-type ATP synthase membrane subunit b/b'/DNA-binding MarR family transcriptional regulator
METIKDLWASIVAYANERSTNPLTSAFVLTWAAWNYKFFVVLFNDETTADKFDAIAELYPRSNNWCLLTDALCAPPDAFWGSAFVYPALTTLFYVFAYPYITKKVVSFYRRRQIDIANEVKAIEKDRVRTVEEVATLVRGYEQKVNAADIDAKAARAEAGELRNALTAAEAELKELRKAASELSEANRQMVHEGINDRNIRYINVRRSADEFIEAFSLRANMASSDLLNVIEPLSQAELKILFYLGDAGERRSTPIETGNFMQMNASEVLPLLHRLAGRELIDLRNDAASISYKGRSVLDRMKEVVSTAV